jgi:hypothetical protein
VPSLFLSGAHYYFVIAELWNKIMWSFWCGAVLMGWQGSAHKGEKDQTLLSSSLGSAET